MHLGFFFSSYLAILVHICLHHGEWYADLITSIYADSHANVYACVSVFFVSLLNESSTGKIMNKCESGAWNVRLPQPTETFESCQSY